MQGGRTLWLLTKVLGWLHWPIPSGLVRTAVIPGDLWLYINSTFIVVFGYSLVAAMLFNAPAAPPWWTASKGTGIATHQRDVGEDRHRHLSDGALLQL